VSAFVAVQGGSLALTGHVERATTGTQGRDTGRDQTGQSTTGHGQRLVVVLRGRLLVALLGLLRLLGLLGLLRLLGLLGLLRLLGNLGLVDLGPRHGSIGAHGDRAVLGGDQGLGRLVGLALEQAAGPSSGATGQAEARLTGLGVLGHGEADGVTVTDRVDGLTGLDIDQLDTLGGVQVDLDVGGVGLDEELADDLTGVAGGLTRSDPQGGLGLLLGQVLGIADQVGVNLLEVYVVAALFEDLVVAEVPDRRLCGPQVVSGGEAFDADLGAQFLGSHVRVAVLQNPVDLAGLGEVALARVVGPVVLQVPGTTADAGLEVDAVHLQNGVTVLDVQVEDGGADGATTHLD